MIVQLLTSTVHSCRLQNRHDRFKNQRVRLKFYLLLEKSAVKFYDMFQQDLKKDGFSFTKTVIGFGALNSVREILNILLVVCSHSWNCVRRIYTSWSE